MQCIVYARVSTRQQAWGHGICRQIEACQQAAKRNNAYVRAVYVDVCSGAGPMPHRAMAVAEAKESGYPIYVESMDRWTRDSQDDTIDDESLSLVFCADWHSELSARVGTLVRKFMAGNAEAGT